ILALVGESGSGKSVTSLSILQLLPKPPASYGGRIMFSENGDEPIDLLSAGQEAIRSVRGNKIAMIFQEPMTSLNPVISCGKQVAEAILAHKKIGAAEARKQAIEWFEKVRLPDPSAVYDRYPHQLSGGQKQRVMIAMAMSCHPSLLICDEPTTALDVTVQKTILELIRELQKQQNLGVIFITHDLGVVAQVADRVAIMYKGEIVEQKPVKDIFSQPDHAYTRALIACRPALHAKGERLPVVADFLSPAQEGITMPQEKAAVSAAKEILLTAKDLTVRFAGKTNLFGKARNYFTAVDGVSFELYKGETLGLVGESGCGKTTLGRTLLQLIPPASGEIVYKDRNITNLSKAEIKSLRKEVQLIFQDPYSSLNPRLMIGSAIEEPMRTSGIEPLPAERRKKAASLLERVNLSPSMMNRYPHEFSGGQRQRIVIARALAMNPGLLVCDESVSALDVSVQAQVLNLLNELKKDLGLTLIFISHDLSVVRYMCDRIMVMQKGRIIESGPAEEVYHHPQSHYTKELLAAVPTL
ncbi:MAG TPA: ABC transporter ATP-binding protein, partial [Flavisolibacter sp.]|nr:ABC transporter ATP-binding protein [Flavisolibacter sp.]